MAPQKPLTAQQRELVNLVKAAHQTLGLARDTRSAEQSRRLQEAKIKAARDWEAIEYAIRDDIDRLITEHAAALDEALIAAYEAGVPMRKIALDGFGNQFDGGVQQKIAKLRDDGRVGVRKGFQRNSGEPETTVEFPKPIDVDSVLVEATSLVAPTFTDLGYMVLIPDSGNRGDGVSTDHAVQVTMDPRDPYFRAIRDQASFSADPEAMTITLYNNPYKPTELRALGLNLDPGERWVNPVAFWVANHLEDARVLFDAAVASSK